MTSRRLATYVAVLELGAGPDRVHAAALRPEQWLSGWRHVRRLDRLADGDRTGLGRRYRTTVRAVAPYDLRWEMEVVSVTPMSITWAATGDLDGVARWDLRGHDGVTEVTSTWTVRPTPRWVGALWPLARRVFVRNHDLVMARGAHRLAAHLDAPLHRYAAHPR